MAQGHAAPTEGEETAGETTEEGAARTGETREETKTKTTTTTTTTTGEVL